MFHFIKQACQVAYDKLKTFKKRTERAALFEMATPIKTGRKKSSQRQIATKKGDSQTVIAGTRRGNMNENGGSFRDGILFIRPVFS